MLSYRKSIRLPEYNYSEPGAYFVTICVKGKEHRLGKVSNGAMFSNDVGAIATDSWPWLESKFPAVQVANFVVMPNHLHAIIVVSATERRGGLQNAPTWTKPLGRIIGAYKTHSTALINKITGIPGASFWQRNYYERVIRNEREFETIQDYIETNLLNWERDEYHTK